MHLAERTRESKEGRKEGRKSSHLDIHLSDAQIGQLTKGTLGQVDVF